MKFCSVILLLCVVLIGAPASAVSDERIGSLQLFPGDASLDNWRVADRATIVIDGRVMVLTKPKYEGGDEAWPRAELDVSHIDFMRFNGIQITVENPTDSTQALDLVLRDGRGDLSYMSTNIEPRSRHTRHLRFKDAYNNVDWSDIRSLSIMRTQPDVTYVWRVEDITLFSDAPRETPHADIGRYVDRAGDAFHEVESLMGTDERGRIRNTIQAWRDKLEEPGGLRGDLSACLQQMSSIAARASQLKAINDSKDQSDPTLLPWSVAPGQTFRPNEAMLQYKESAKRLIINAARGEYGDTILRLTNLGTASKSIQVTVNNQGDENLPSPTVRQNIPVLARDGTLCGDALAPMNPSGVVTLPPNETVELWLRVDARHQNWPSGKHHYEIGVRDLRVAKSPMTRIPLEVHVFNFDLNDAKPLRAHFWPELRHTRSWIVHGREDLARYNLSDYGSNVTTVIAAQLPWPRFSPGGEIESIDFNEHDQEVTYMREVGTPMLLFWMEMDVDKEDNWGLRAGLVPGSPEWTRALYNWISVWKQHLAESGLSPSEYAFYVTDEPNREELDRTLLFASVVKSVDPDLQIYINSSSDLWDDPVKNERLIELCDIWQPDESHQSPMLRSMLASYSHLERWVYQCRMARRNYDVNAHDYYRLISWRAMRDGVTGIAFWTYCATHPEEDPWDGTRGATSGGILVYPDTAGGLIMSARWELVRMGLDDARYVDLLRQSEPADSLHDQRKQSLLNERLQEIIAHPDKPELLVEWRRDAGQLIEASIQ